MSARKLLRRGWVVIQNSANSLLQPLWTIGISLLVIRLASEALWGEFIAVLILVQLGAHIAAWGNRDYLLREFSHHPDHIPSLWHKSLSSRVMLLAAMWIALPLLFEPTLWPWIIAWSLAQFVSQSFDVVIVYRRAFAFSILVEILTTGIILTLIPVNRGALDLHLLVSVFTVSAIVRTLLFGWRFRDVGRGWRFAPSRRFMRDALPFFLLGFSGILASRMDLYVVSAWMSAEDTGRYQVFINLMLYLQALAQFIVLPYLRSLYRLGDESLFKVSRRLFALGIVALIPALITAYGVFSLLYGIEYSLAFMLLGGAFVLPIYGYLPLVHRLYKRAEEVNVLRANVVGATLNLPGNLLLLPIFGIAGALMSSAIIQWGMLGYYLWDARGSHERHLSNLPA